MINTKKFLSILSKIGITQCVGVPDSVLKNFLSIVPENKNFISNNEGSAVAYGIGYFLATKKIPLIYLQNSGLGNAINPLVSIAHPKVYSIPLLLLIGWRGSPSSKDEAQHLAQGKITKDFLKLLGIKTLILKKNNDLKKINKLVQFAKKNKKPVAILVENKKFEKVSKKKSLKRNNFDIKRIVFLEHLLKKISKNYRLISTTGYTSRELFQLRRDKNLKKGSDFYMVGGMGHASNVALGYSKNSKKKILVIDGDGSFLMHLGGLVNSGVKGDNNYKYILLNNYCHESVGSQKTLINKVDLKLISRGIGFNNYIEIKNEKEINKKIDQFINSKKKVFMNVRIKEGSINGLIRPKNLSKIKDIFIKN